MEVWRTHGINNYGFGIIPAGGGRFWVPTWERVNPPIVGETEVEYDPKTGLKLAKLPVIDVVERLTWTLAGGGDRIDGWDFGASTTKIFFRELPENIESVANLYEKIATASYLFAPATGGTSLTATKVLQAGAVGLRGTATVLEGVNVATIGSDPSLAGKRFFGFVTSGVGLVAGEALIGLKASGVAGPIFRSSSTGQFVGNYDAIVRLVGSSALQDLLISVTTR